MKNYIVAIAVSIGMWSCSDANDGDPTTDTSTTIPPDPAVMNGGTMDTASTINTNTGTYSADSASRSGDSSLNKKNNVRSSSSAYPDGRGAKKTDSLNP